MVNDVRLDMYGLWAMVQGPGLRFHHRCELVTQLDAARGDVPVLMGTGLELLHVYMLM